MVEDRAFHVANKEISMSSENKKSTGIMGDDSAAVARADTDGTGAQSMDGQVGGGDPLVLGPGEGRRFATITVKTDAGTSPVAIFESEPPPGVLVAPPHLHQYTESFYVLGGEIEFRLRERTVRCGAGAFVHVPPGAVHGFHNPGPGPARLLILVYPATGFGIIEDMYALLAAGAPDRAALSALFAKHHSALFSAERGSDEP
jgi:mannose-6-phosphate isomerase-like protein (cupin superfamily)